MITSECKIYVIFISENVYVRNNTYVQLMQILNKRKLAHVANESVQ
jgi:hypothetical protein